MLKKIIITLAINLFVFSCQSPNEKEEFPPQRGKAGNKGRSRPTARDTSEGGNTAAVPVEVALVERRTVSSYLETNGSLEAENDIYIVARTQGPIVELIAEEGMRFVKDEVMLKIEETESRAQVEIGKVALKEATRAHDRAKAARTNEIISQEVYDTALAQFESAQAQLKGSEILYEYTTVRAPFDGIVVDRQIKLAEMVTVNQQLFRFSQFNPLLVKVQVPEKELSRLQTGQKAFLNVEAWPDERFDAEVLRVSPVVDPTTGTIRVTLQVSTREKLSPGMFASVFLVVDTHEDATVMPKRALSIESLTDTVFVVNGAQAERRDISLGYAETLAVEVLSGLNVGEQVIVVGQDGLTDGTPVQILKGPGANSPRDSVSANSIQQGTDSSGKISRQMNFSNLSPEQLERAKKRMRDRGMSTEQIEKVIARQR